MLSFNSQAQTRETKRCSFSRGRFPSLLPVMSHRGLFFEDCGGLGKQQGISGTCLEEEMQGASGKDSHKRN